jgi:glycosyltransferase involved in cell wall biosynthesis
MTPLRVVSVTHGGMSRHTGRLRYVPLAGRDDIDLTLLVPAVWHEYGTTRLAEPASDGLNVVISKTYFNAVGPAKWYLQYYKDLARVLLEYRPNVIHLWQEPWSFVASHAQWLRDRLLPDAAVLLETDQNILRRLPPPFEWARRRALASTDLLIARQAEAEAVSRACGYRGPARFVGYGIDPEIFHPGAAPREHRRDGLALGYVGRVIRDKGIFDILEALALQADRSVQFTVMGDGADRAAFEERARALGLSDRVFVRASGSLDEVAGFMRSLDACLLMSRSGRTWKEQFGRVIIESQACGVPVIGSDSGAIPEVVGAGGWIVPEGNPAALAALFARLRANPGAIADAGASGLANVASRFTYARVSEQLRDAYETAAAVRAARRAETRLGRDTIVGPVGRGDLQRSDVVPGES